jgi:hypothetical protein
MPSDANFISGEIDRLAFTGDTASLAQIARSLLAELADLRESPLAVLEPGEEWPHMADIPESELTPFVEWLANKKKPRPDNDTFLYFPWHLAEWRAEQAGVD